MGEVKTSPSQAKYNTKGGIYAMGKSSMIILVLVNLILAIRNDWKLINSIGLVIVSACTLAVIIIDIISRRVKNGI